MTLAHTGDRGLEKHSIQKPPMAFRRKYPRRPVPALWPIDMLLLVVLALLAAVALYIATGGIGRWTW